MPVQGLSCSHHFAVLGCASTRVSWLMPDYGIGLAALVNSQSTLSLTGYQVPELTVCACVMCVVLGMWSSCQLQRQYWP